MIENRVTVVIPFYKGNRYLSYWIMKLEKNIENLQAEKPESSCEILFINDCPEEELFISDEVPQKVNLKIYNLPENRGIHGARVFGYENASGEYIVFIDQDDKISDDYLLSQLEHIGENDVVVCNGYYERFCMSGRRVIFKDALRHQDVMDIENYIRAGNRIWSPGQVLMRRDAIPMTWINNIMRINGADDYLLWILMLKNNKKFGINENKLYTHVGHGDNASANDKVMKKSMEEMLTILEREGSLQTEECELIRNKYSVNYASDNKFQQMMLVYDYWMYLKLNGRNTAEYFTENGYQKIAIYGMNYIGSRLYDELKPSEVEVIFGIDQNASLMEHEIPIYVLGDIDKHKKDIDAIVVTAVSAYDDIRNALKECCDVPVLSIKEILIEMCNQ